MQSSHFIIYLFFYFVKQTQKRKRKRKKEEAKSKRDIYGRGSSIITCLNSFKFEQIIINDRYPVFVGIRKRSIKVIAQINHKVYMYISD
jgi:hypothetical protein